MRGQGSRWSSLHRRWESTPRDHAAGTSVGRPTGTGRKAICEEMRDLSNAETRNRGAWCRPRRTCCRLLVERARLRAWHDGAMADLATRAQQLLDLHHSGTTLVLPTVWDAWSANAVVAAGFPALTIGSHPLADSRGQGDNEAMSLDDALDGIRRITAAVDVPVSADMESGYDTAATELVERILDAGAVGINIEDTVHSESVCARPLSTPTTSGHFAPPRTPPEFHSWSTPAPTLFWGEPRCSTTRSPKRSVVCGRARRPAPDASTRSRHPMPLRCGHCSTSSRDRSTSLPTPSTAPLPAPSTTCAPWACTGCHSDRSSR
jgi:hypothetical protein